ncbi:bolA-like protein 3 isoform X2 [Leptotrombidium deliense]|uniref:BolA-like protein 3 isoform X2 n=1 Tax=Leptotrombidium deliense TaxID=299467 RepID=A0A443SA76_9ACAR|nr:bolA-like protein 3 isoform X2 [Leptotrombidium deliense]
MISSLVVRFARKHTSIASLVRFLSGELKCSEESLTQALKGKFPNAEKIEVNDISGGCGQMFQVSVVCSSFKDKSYVQQHRMVNDALKEQIKSMHALRIQTSQP